MIIRSAVSAAVAEIAQTSLDVVSVGRGGHPHQPCVQCVDVCPLLEIPSRHVPVICQPPQDAHANVRPQLKKLGVVSMLLGPRRRAYSR